MKLELISGSMGYYKYIFYNLFSDVFQLYKMYYLASKYFMHSQMLTSTMESPWKHTIYPVLAQYLIYMDTSWHVPKKTECVCVCGGELQQQHLFIFQMDSADPMSCIVGHILYQRKQRRGWLLQQHLFFIQFCFIFQQATQHYIFIVLTCTHAIIFDGNCKCTLFPSEKNVFFCYTVVWSNFQSY